jgi:hypothetical protein
MSCLALVQTHALEQKIGKFSLVNVIMRFP